MGRKKRTKIIIVIFAAAIVCAVLVVGGIMIYGKYQISKIPGLTFTAALVNKAIAEGKLRIDDTIDNLLPLPEAGEYPTIKELLTHTSGYKGYYFQSSMISNFLKGRNDFYGITKEMVLEAVYHTDYAALVNGFAQNELELTETGISGKSGDLGNYWDWKANDAYLPAGAITSNITDMLSYAQIQLEGNQMLLPEIIGLWASIWTRLGCPG